MKLNRLAAARKQIEQMKKRGAKLKFNSCGKVLIDGLPFSFSAVSIGGASNKGIVVSFSGEPVENGRLSFGSIELRYTQNGRARSTAKKLARIVKSDGKHIYQAKFTEVTLEDYQPTGRKADSDMFLSDISSAFSFRVTPSYKEEQQGEVMLTVYPIEDPLSGLAVEWKPCTSDKDWFEHNPDALKPVKKKRFFGR